MCACVYVKICVYKIVQLPFKCIDSLPSRGPFFFFFNHNFSIHSYMSRFCHQIFSPRGLLGAYILSSCESVNVCLTPLHSNTILLGLQFLDRTFFLQKLTYAVPFSPCILILLYRNMRLALFMSLLSKKKILLPLCRCLTNSLSLSLFFNVQ